MTKKLYDAHCHHLYPEYVKEVQENHLTEDGFPLVTDWSPQKQLEFMDEAGIQWCLLALSSPHPHYHNDKKCADLMRKLNENLAEFKQKHPDRIGFAASLPHPNNDLAIEEAIYSLDVLGADSVKLASNSRGLYMGDKQMEPLFAELDKRQVVLTMHPHKPSQVDENLFTASLLPLFEFISDTTRAVLNMIANGVIERYPNVTLIVPHNGSFLPNVYDRFQRILNNLVERGLREPIDFQANFEKLYFDTSGNPNPNTEFLLTYAKPEKIMYGSDFPFTAKNVVISKLKETKEYYAANERIAPYTDLIFTENCKRLFKLP